MSDEDRDDRMKDRLSGRFNAGDDNDDNDDNEENDVVDVVEDNDGNDETDSNDDVAPQQRSVRDTTGRTFYVGEDTLDELDALYKELEFRYYQEYGDDLPKNKQFYPALFEVVVENPELVAEKLGLEPED
ncbi:hypothetical protein [Haloarcula argentinensis]|uniref:DUF8160 domain-containing protein n=1 Tax=Haloarcula argentinensis TaxID=43776 RepID=A0ABU2F694_HALAR|nr:hypothetical protein [Haloarcula argentinensis]MDS0256017.1 hypothetical protein [Haloarcula argentinensis]